MTVNFLPMPKKNRTFLARNKKTLLVFSGIVLLIWVTLLDSHSLWTRFTLSLEQRDLRAENEQLAADIDRITSMLDKPLSNADIERIAREKYSMQRSDEMVYPLVDQ